MPCPLPDSTHNLLGNSPKPPEPWPDRAEGSPSASFKAIRGVCLDIDETLSTQGKLTAEAFSALWSLSRAGFAVVPITGRPAGWCDHIIRFWPVDAVVGENGAFTFYMDQGVRRSLVTPCGLERTDQKEKRSQLASGIQQRFPKAQWASDQDYRQYDLAVDICEDVQPWSAAETAQLLEYCHVQGAHAKLSSIHVNTWYGNYDKKKGFEYWLNQGAPGLDPQKHSFHKTIEKLNIGHDSWIYIGDSPNDEPMFASFTHSVGVANIKKYLPQLKTPPKWVTSAESGAGFVEMAEFLVSVEIR